MLSLMCMPSPLPPSPIALACIQTTPSLPPSSTLKVPALLIDLDLHAGRPLPAGLSPDLAEQAKGAITEFRLLSRAADGLTSVVQCCPLTGRTHQIRVHLQHLGHPVANDTQYGGCLGLPLAIRRLEGRIR